eukprot:11612507-Alexandrium_andersonii.AAC.1
MPTNEQYQAYCATVGEGGEKLDMLQWGMRQFAQSVLEAVGRTASASSGVAPATSLAPNQDAAAPGGVGAGTGEGSRSRSRGRNRVRKSGEATGAATAGLQSEQAS